MYNKIVTKHNWVNDTDPAINDVHLNEIEDELDQLDDRVIELQGDCEEQAENAEAWAKGTRGGDPVPQTDETYNNNSKYFKEQAAAAATNAHTSETNAGNSATAASGSATAASGSANTASQKALDSEAWAVGERGGEPVAPTDPTYENSAKHWAERAAAGQIQSDWNQTDNAKKDFIKNKPTIPSTASDIGAGTFTGKVRADATAMETLSDAQLRDATISNTNLTAGTSSLAPGSVYLYYTT